MATPEDTCTREIFFAGALAESEVVAGVAGGFAVFAVAGVEAGALGVAWPFGRGEVEVGVAGCSGVPDTGVVEVLPPEECDEGGVSGVWGAVSLLVAPVEDSTSGGNSLGGRGRK